MRVLRYKQHIQLIERNNMYSVKVRHVFADKIYTPSAVNHLQHLPN